MYKYVDKNIQERIWEGQTTLTKYLSGKKAQAYVRGGAKEFLTVSVTLLQEDCIKQLLL